MATLAIAHHDAERARALAQRLVACGRAAHLSLCAYVMSNLDMVDTLDQPDAPTVDVLLLEASRAQALPWPPSKQSEGRELVLLDASPEQLTGLLRLKPVASLSADERDPRVLAGALVSALHYVRTSQRFFVVKTKTRSLRIPYDAIRYLESGRRRVIVHTSDENDLCSFSATLDSVQRSLPDGRFIRCHQSFIVNADAVRGVDRPGRALQLEGGVSVSVSDRYWRTVVDAFGGEARRQSPSATAEGPKTAPK